MTEGELTALRARYIELLRGHDWSWQYSADQTTYHLGFETEMVLKQQREQLPDGVQLWNAYAPLNRKVTP